MKIAYKYSGNKEYIEKLKEYDMVLLFETLQQFKEIEKYNITKRNIKYDCNEYDILISETDDVRNIMAKKKVIIGNCKEKKPRYYYLDKLDINKIFEKPIKKQYKFSIIIPNYNNAEWIGKTIESVLNQTYQDWEMYIIDDLSTDNSVEVIKKYNDKRITLIENKIKWYNGGSRNWGILKAKESNPDGYLLFIDSDDWLYNEKVLEELNNFIEDEDLITLDFTHWENNTLKNTYKNSYKNKDDLFMTLGAMCAVWCKCFKVSVAPLFEFNTLMEDRNYHYKLVNRIDSYIDFGKITHVWNKMNKKSITSDFSQKYGGELQTKLEWKNCAYRHLAGMLDLLDEIKNPLWKQFIEQRIDGMKKLIRAKEFHQF